MKNFQLVTLQPNLWQNFKEESFNQIYDHSFNEDLFNSICQSFSEELFNQTCHKFIYSIYIYTSKQLSYNTQVVLYKRNSTTFYDIFRATYAVEDIISKSKYKRKLILCLSIRKRNSLYRYFSNWQCITHLKTNLFKHRIWKVM